MIFKLTILVSLALVATVGCSSSAKRSVAQETRQSCSQPQSLEEVQRLTFENSYSNLQGAGGQNVIHSDGVKIEVQLGSTEAADIPQGLTLQRSGSSLVDFTSVESNRSYKVTCYTDTACAESRMRNGKKECMRWERTQSHLETPCTIGRLNMIFSLGSNCQTLHTYYRHWTHSIY